MSAALMVRGNPRGSGYVRAADDWYAEPPRAVRALLDAEPFEGAVWDPCCGMGTIPTVCREEGLDAWGTDKAPRGFETDRPQADFLSLSVVRPMVPNIITNPPYRGIEQFILRGLQVAERKVAVLALLTLLEGQRRAVILAAAPLARVLVFSRRIGCPPGHIAKTMSAEERNEQSGAKPYAWFVFDKAHAGRAATVHRI